MALNSAKRSLKDANEGSVDDSEPPSKKQKMSASDSSSTSSAISPKRIGTHSGNFHCDDVLACYMLCNHTNAYRDCEIVRTRDAKVWPTLDILVDVGDQFDPINHRFDHHQKGFNQKWDEPRKTVLSSAGLVYKYFGKEIIRDILENEAWNNEPSVYSINNTLFRPPVLPTFFYNDSTQSTESKQPDSSSTSSNSANNANNASSSSSANCAGTGKMSAYCDETIELVWKRLYDTFIEEIDAVDNGVNQYSNVPASDANYSISTTLSSRVGKFNPSWTDPNGKDADYILKHFYYAMNYIGYEFRDKVRSCVKDWLPARDIVKNALLERKKTHASGQVMILKTFCPWKEHFWNLLEEMNIKDEEMPLYILLPDMKGGWRIRAAPESRVGFGLKKALPEQWRGKRNEELDKIAGVEGCIFVHNSGFIGGNQSFEGALQMAVKALQM